MEPPATGSSDATHKASGEISPAITIGSYRLLQSIGEGGMGEVWLAEQTHPVHRRVALKIIKVGMDSAQVVARFDAERQALALMDHPAIATVFDGGTTPQGRPYFAMEYVKGEPITAYCDRHRLSTRERLELFIRVCEGVQHAHQKGVIHRDLKPSNVLVTVHDDRPAPKIIDFGIAKATTQHLTDRTLFTEFGVLIGTPEYMSPEQAELTGLDVDTRTDVYALGVLLYELLTGTLPFDGSALRQKGLDEIRRVIREVEPPRPSTRITQLGPTSTEAAKNRHSDPAKLAGQLRGDLDWITMKALEKDRTRRYDTVMGLANDVRRHLQDEPVMAGPPSATYRATKFVRRHRFGVATAAALTVLLIALVTIMAVQSKRIADERDRANREAETAKGVSQFLIGLFEFSKPSAQAANSITVREVLDRGADRIQHDLKGEPEIQARLLSTMGEAYRSLGLYDRAESLQQQTLGVQRRLHGASSPEVARTLLLLSRCQRNQGNHQGAEQSAREALGMLRAKADQQPSVADALTELGQALSMRGNYPEAERVMRDAYRLYRENPGTSEQTLAACAYALGGILFDQSKLTEAEATAKETVERRGRTLGPDHPQTVTARAMLANVWMAEKKFTQAEVAYREIVALNRRQLGPDHPLLAASLNNLGAVLFFEHKYGQAEECYRESLAVSRRSLGDRHPDIATRLKNIGQALTMQGKYAEAERILREALAIDEATRGPDHPDTALTLTFLAGCLCQRAKPQLAEVAARRAIAINTTRLGAAHPWTRESERALGCALVGLRRFAEAEPLLLTYMTALETVPGMEGEPDQAAQELADLYAAWGKVEKAAQWRSRLRATR